MLDISKLPFFLIATAALVIVPGPAVFYIVTRSVDRGRLAGLVSALGVALGGCFHIAAAALGVSALLTSSAVAFNTLKYIGAAYLIYLGIRRLMAPDDDPAKSTRSPHRMSRIFYEGMLVNLLNPKTALFFLAFLPQFVDPSLGPVSVQLMLLGAIFVAFALFSDGVYALLAGTAGDWFKRRRRGGSVVRYFSGGIYIALGLATALSGNGRNK